MGSRSSRVERSAAIAQPIEDALKEGVQQWSCLAEGAIASILSQIAICFRRSLIKAVPLSPSTNGSFRLCYTFRARNRIIAGLSRATLIVEAGLPSGTFSTADDALSSNREVLVVPGAITSPTSRGANRLLYQGATPIVDEETFEDVIFNLYGCLKVQDMRKKEVSETSLLFAALQAEQLSIDALMEKDDIGAPLREKRLAWLMVELAKLEHEGFIERFPNGSYGACVV